MAFILIALLMIYQTLEFLMCTLNLKYSFMAYLAFVDISFLPPLNFYFIFSYAGYRSKLLMLVFLPAVAFVVYYSLAIDKFAVTTCTVLYAAYSYPLGGLFGLFYYTPVAAAIILLAVEIKKQSAASRKKLLKILLSGLIFISLPVFAAFILLVSGNKQLLQIIESVMCKFAFVYAVCLAYFTLVNKNTAYE